jgi:hypothetical protein
MPTKILILHFNVQRYLDRFGPKFPSVQFHGFHHAEEATSVVADVDVIMGSATTFRRR